MSTNATTTDRFEFIDAQRGLAVVLMIWMHTADGWLLPELKQGAAWGAIRAVGGLAAPTFLLLSGLSLGIGWGASARPYDSRRRRAALARGLQIVVLGYALRLQMWMIDAGGIGHFYPWVAALPLGTGLWNAYGALASWGRGEPEPRRGLIAVAGVLVGGLLVSVLIPGRLWNLTRVDVLQAIGASVVCLACAGAALKRWPVVGLAAGFAVALLTPWVRTLMPGPLSHAIAGYVAAWDPGPGMRQPTLFPLFPWLAYAWVGASLGVYLGRVRKRGGSVERAALVLSAGGLLLALASCEPLPLGRAIVGTWPALTQLVRVAYRVGISVVLGGLAVEMNRMRVPWRAGLLNLGRASLFVYWVHLEFAFGVLIRPIAHALSFHAWALGLVVLTVAMSALSALWLRARGRDFSDGARGRRIGEADTAPATLTRI